MGKNQEKVSIMRFRKFQSLAFTAVSLAAIIGIWWWLAETQFKTMEIIPSPLRTLGIMGKEMQSDGFFKAILSTLFMSIKSFLISFFAATILACLAYWKKFFNHLLTPFIVTIRSMPTLALVLILIMAVGADVLPIIVAFLVVFPLCYENMHTAIGSVNKDLLKMARVFKVPFYRQVSEIYAPALTPYIFSSIIAGFGLNIKVVISAEVLGLPSMSIGYAIMSANQSLNFPLAFAWLVIAVMLSLVCEVIIRIIRRFCMPWKYSDRKIIKRWFKKLFARKKEAINDKV